MNVPGHDSDFALAWRNNSRTVRSGGRRARRVCKNSHARTISSAGMPSVMQIMQFDLSISGFHDRVGGKRWGNKDDRSVRAGFVHGFLNAVEYRKTLVRSTALAGSDSTNDLRSIFRTCLRVERPFAAGETLHDYACRFVDENAQALFRPQGRKKLENYVLPEAPRLRPCPDRIVPLCEHFLRVTLYSLWLDVLLDATRALTTEDTEFHRGSFQREVRAVGIRRLKHPPPLRPLSRQRLSSFQPQQNLVQTA